MQFGSYHVDPNIFIFAILGVFFVLTFLFGETRLRRVALALLAGLFAADQLTSFAMTQLFKSGGDGQEMMIKLGILGVILVLMSLGRAPSVGGHFSIRSMVLSLLTAVTLLAYVFSYLPPGEQSQLGSDYNLAAIAMNNRSWWLVGLIFWLILLQLWKKKVKEDDSGGSGKGKKKGKKK